MKEEGGGQSDDIDADEVAAINEMVSEGNPNSWPAEMRYEEFLRHRVAGESHPNCGGDEPV